MTLVEMLTAMMVSVMLIGTAFSTFWAATQAWDKAKRRTEMVRLLEGSAQVLTRHLRAIQPPFLQTNPVFLAYNDSDETGDYDAVYFLSSANPRSPRELAMSDLCEIAIYIDTGLPADETAQPTDVMTGEATDQTAATTEQTAAETGPGGLWLRMDPTPDEDIETGGYLIELGDMATGLNFRFFDGVEWMDDWLDDTLVPEAVEFTLTVSDPMERENPMTMTRLVTIPLAKAINAGAFVPSSGTTGSQTSTSTGGDSTGSGQSGTSSGGSSTGSTGGGSSGGVSSGGSSGGSTTRGR